MEVIKLKKAIICLNWSSKSFEVLNVFVVSYITLNNLFKTQLKTKWILRRYGTLENKALEKEGVGVLKLFFHQK